MRLKHLFADDYVLMVQINNENVARNHNSMSMGNKQWHLSPISAKYLNTQVVAKIQA